jgi:hypothetical protein
VLAHILERNIEVVANLVAHDPADADATRLCQRFERAATLTPSPKMSPSSMMMSPILMPMRNSMRRSAGTLDVAVGHLALPQ